MAFYAPSSSEWPCARCTFANQTTSPRCEMCDAARPPASQLGVASPTRDTSLTCFVRQESRKEKKKQRPPLKHIQSHPMKGLPKQYPQSQKKYEQQQSHGLPRPQSHPMKGLPEQKQSQGLHRPQSQPSYGLKNKGNHKGLPKLAQLNENKNLKNGATEHNQYAQEHSYGTASKKHKPQRVPVEDIEEERYYYADGQGRPIGPFTRRELKKKFDLNTIDESTEIWTPQQTQDDAVPLWSHPELFARMSVDINEENESKLFGKSKTNESESKALKGKGISNNMYDTDEDERVINARTIIDENESQSDDIDLEVSIDKTLIELSQKHQRQCCCACCSKCVVL
eukprot:692809_1